MGRQKLSALDRKEQVDMYFRSGDISSLGGKEKLKLFLYEKVKERVDQPAKPQPQIQTNKQNMASAEMSENEGQLNEHDLYKKFVEEKRNWQTMFTSDKEDFLLRVRNSGLSESLKQALLKGI